MDTKFAQSTEKFRINSTGNKWTVDGIRGEFRVKPRTGGWADIVHHYSDGEEYKIVRVGNVCTHTWGPGGCANVDLYRDVSQKIIAYLARMDTNSATTPLHPDLTDSVRRRERQGETKMKTQAWLLEEQAALRSEHDFTPDSDVERKIDIRSLIAETHKRIEQH